MSSERHDCFAITAPGLESITAGELRAMGLRARAEPGGAAFSADNPTLYDANLRLRTASRVLVRIARFHVTAFHELERHAGRVPWERFVEPSRPVAFRVTCRKSRLYHSDAVAERLLRAVARRTGSTAAEGAEESEADDESGDGAAPLFVARIARDECTISVDSSGALLHRRGYRQESAKAPLRETLAAAMLLASGWSPDAPLIDPLCGSGTIPIEGALLARRVPPGHARPFAFMHWPGFDEPRWREIRERALAEALPAAPAPIVATDRDAGAVATSAANATRAGVAADLTIERRSVSALEAPSQGPGWVVTNPPYGVRIGDRSALRDLYARLGQVARRELSGWTLALLAPDRTLPAQLRLDLKPAFRTVTGGIPVECLVTRVP